MPLRPVTGSLVVTGPGATADLDAAASDAPPDPGAEAVRIRAEMEAACA